MNTQNIIILSLSIIWILNLIVFAVLAFWWKNKFKNYQKSRKDFHAEILLKQKSYILKEKQLKYDLPTGEVGYIQIISNVYYQKNKKGYKHSFSFFYRQKKLHKKICEIFLSNNNLVLEFEDNNFKKIDILKINSMIPFYFFDGKKYIKGIELIFENKRFLIDPSDNFDLLFAFKKVRGEK